MSDDDPFAEPDDTERTVIRPNPGGRRPMTPAPVAPAPPNRPGDRSEPADVGASDTGVANAGVASRRGGDATIETSMTGMNPLNAAAATLFSLVSRIRNRAQHPDPEALRRSVVAEVRAFENRALQAQVDAQNVKVARYAICATLDDVVLNTPWGESSVWAQQSMVGTFHRETVGGDRFFDLLARLEQDPGRNIDLLEFLYMCLSLGFEGRLRVAPGGADKHTNIRAGLARIIRAQRGPMEPDLSPHWVGLDKPHRALSAWKPFWVSVAAVAVLLGAGFMGLTYALTSSTERLLGQMTTLEPATVATLERRAPPPPPPPPPPPDQEAQLKRVSSFLQSEIDEGLVNVFQDANTITVRLKGSNMFASASDALRKEFVVPLQRVAAALNDTKGPVMIVGHSDSQPIRTARFPSNAHLSLARAESVRKTLESQIDDPSRLKAEGQADKVPIESNATAEGRAANRRIEILLLREQVE